RRKFVGQTIAPEFILNGGAEIEERQNDYRDWFDAGARRCCGAVRLYSELRYVGPLRHFDDNGIDASRSTVIGPKPLAQFDGFHAHYGVRSRVEGGAAVEHLDAQHILL